MLCIHLKSTLSISLKHFAFTSLRDAALPLDQNSNDESRLILLLLGAFEIELTTRCV